MQGRILSDSANQMLTSFSESRNGTKNWRFLEPEPPIFHSVFIQFLVAELDSVENVELPRLGESPFACVRAPIYRQYFTRGEGGVYQEQNALYHFFDLTPPSAP